MISTLLASALEPRMLVWLAGARLHAGRGAVPFDGADGACLVAFAHPPGVAAYLESCIFLLRCTLQLASSLAVAPRDLACLLAPRPGSA